MSDRAPATLPSTITCQGYVLRRELLDDYNDEGFTGYRHEHPQAPFIAGYANRPGEEWAGFSERTGLVDGATWQEVVRKLERRPLGERVGAGLLRAWRLVKEVCGG